MIRLEAQHLCKVYNGKTALDDLTLAVNEGEVFCLLGQNGAGKTTTINLFLGLLAPTSGKACINGVEVKPHSGKTNQFVAYIPEVVMLYGELTGIENLHYFSKLAGFTYSKDHLATLLSLAGLQPEAFTRRLKHYSKGMRQKVGIAIALAKNADVLLMDEPTSGLDPKAATEFTRLVMELGQQGKAVLMATHDIFNAVDVGTQVGIMREGKLSLVMHTRDINAKELQDLYLKTI
jgi:ABC-2 type transport system ATP-binding protein